jgi:hydrogenase large subunit
MTQTIVGPFNRVEGDLEVGLDIVDGDILSARVTTTLYRGFEQLLVGRAAIDALVIAPRICGICSVSQSVAAATALRQLSGASATPNGLIATNIAHAAENVADHLTHFYLFFMPDFARAEYAGRPWAEAAAQRFKAISGDAAHEILPARKRWLEVMGIIAGKWPHSLAFQPGGVTRAIDLGERVRLLALIGEFRVFVEQSLFAAPLDVIMALETVEELEAYADASAGDFAAFLRISRDLRLDRLGRGPGAFLSFGAYHGPEGALFPAGRLDQGAAHSLDLEDLGEDVARSWFRASAAHPRDSETLPDADKPGGYSWAKAPRLGGRPAEVGAVARQLIAGHPLIVDIVNRDGGAGVRARIVSRLLEIAALTHVMSGWTRALRLREPFCVDVALPEAGTAAGLIEAARGALGHWMTIADRKIARHQIIAPTTWNFSPRDSAGRPGPLESALAGLHVGELGAKAAIIQHVVRSFDPCMVCTAH